MEARSAADASRWSLKRVGAFLELGERYREFAREAGIDLKVCDDPALPHFNGKSASEQEEVLEGIASAVRICERTRSEGKSQKDVPALTWQALKELRLRPPSNLFTHITEESVIEIHSPEGIQLYRNFNFYRYCSYSLEDLHCRSWAALYERDVTVIQQMMITAQRLYMGLIPETVKLDIPDHVVRETSSSSRYAVDLRMEWLAPLYREGTSIPAATVVLEAATLVRGVRPDSSTRIPRGQPTALESGDQ